MIINIGNNYVVGSKQTLRAMQSGELISVYIAEDTDVFLKSKLQKAAQIHGIEVCMAESMKLLGLSCRIDVGAACVGIRK